MPVGILVATPYAAFGELIRISLEDNGQYNVRLVFSGKEARLLASRGSFQVAILDSALNDEPFIPLCKDMLAFQKNIRLVIIPPENNPNHPSLDGLVAHGFINRPFYLPDLIDTVERLVKEQNTEISTPAVAETEEPSWLQDPQIIQAYLEKEITSTQAIFGIITRFSPEPGRNNLQVMTSRLSNDAAAEFSTIIFRYWNREEKTDLMRFIRLTMDKKDYLVYATQMSGDLILILAYASTAPLSQIRPQTKSVASRISTLPPKDLILTKPSKDEGSNLVEALSEVTQEAAPSPSDNGRESDADSELREVSPLAEPSSQPLDDESIMARLQSGFSPVNHPEESEDEEDFDQEVPNLSALLGAIPAPNASARPPSPPHRGSSPAATKPLNESMELWKDWRLPSDENQEEISSPLDQSTHPAAEASGITPQISEPSPAPQIDIEKTRVSPPAAQVSEISSQEFTLPSNLALLEEAAINPIEDTRPHVVTSITSLGQLEPVSPALSQITYTCILLPRIPYHYLTGELADRMAQWIHQLCLAFGWRLEAISLRPEYLQWTVQVAPSISPGNVVRIIRQKTSVYIFSQFAQIREQNPSGDFWAYGYLIVSGSQSPSSQLLREYITQTRKRQGVIK